jgi:hypothetical protein
VRESARDCIRRSVENIWMQTAGLLMSLPFTHGCRGDEGTREDRARPTVPAGNRDLSFRSSDALQFAWQERRQSGLITNFPNPVCAVTHIACALQLAWDRKEAALANRGSEMGMAPFGAIRAKQTRNRRVALLT